MNFWTQKGSETLPPIAKSKAKLNRTPKKRNLNKENRFIRYHV